MDDIVVAVPSGIGDISWAYSKLKHVGCLKYEIAGGWPQRSREYMEMLPCVKSAQYGDFEYKDILNFEDNQGWLVNGTQAKDIFSKGYGRYLLEPNRHLEMGKPLKDWLPDLPTDYHYDITIPKEHVDKAHARLASFEGPITLVSCASYRGSEAWKTWGFEEWKRFLEMAKAEVGGTFVMVGGFWDDLTAAFEDEGYPCIVGKTHIATMIAMLTQADYYVGFSSGLGILRTVLRKNSFMLWPDFQVSLSTSWADPEDLETDKYVAVLWRDPSLTIKRYRTWLKKNPV